MTQLYPFTHTADTWHAKASAATRLRSSRLVGSSPHRYRQTRLCLRISRHLPCGRRTGSYVDRAPRTAVRRFNHGIFSPAFLPLGIIRLFNWFVNGEKQNREKKSCGKTAAGRVPLRKIKSLLQVIDNKRVIGGCGGSRTNHYLRQHISY